MTRHKGSKIMDFETKQEQNENKTRIKRGRGRPKGSLTNKPRKAAYDIIKRQFNYALSDMEKDPDKPLHKIIKDALTKDIRDIRHFAFLFPQQKQTDIDVKLVKTINVVSDRIRDYKEERKIAKAKTIDVTPTKIEE